MADEVKRHVYVTPYIYADADTPPCSVCHAPEDAPQHYRQPVELSDTGKKWLEAVKAADVQLAALSETVIKPIVERREAALRNVQAELGDAEAATIGGRPVALWAYKKPAQMFDLDRFRADHAELAAQYMKDKKAARPFALVEVTP